MPCRDQAFKDKLRRKKWGDIPTKSQQTGRYLGYSGLAVELEADNKRWITTKLAKEWLLKNTNEQTLALQVLILLNVSDMPVYTCQPSDVPLTPLMRMLQNILCRSCLRARKDGPVFDRAEWLQHAIPCNASVHQDVHQDAWLQDWVSDLRTLTGEKNLTLADERIAVDHIIPQCLGGINHPYNYFLMWQPLNSSFSGWWTSEKSRYIGKHIVKHAMAVSRMMMREGTGRMQPFQYHTKLIDTGI